MKECKGCGRLLTFDAFDSKNVHKSRLRSRCKRCRGEYGRAYYLLHRSKLNENRLTNMRLYRLRARRHVKAVLEASRCADCGESDRVVLEFDHVRGTKRIPIAAMVGQGFALAAIDAEIAKCEVRCANCHRRKTAGDRRWSSRVQPNSSMRSPEVMRGAARKCLTTRTRARGPVSSMVEHPAFNRVVRSSSLRRGNRPIVSSAGEVQRLRPLRNGCAQLSFLKHCARCHEPKPMSDFPKRASRRGAADSYCIRCTRTYHRAYYQEHAQNHRTAVAANSLRRRARNCEMLAQYLLAHPCIDCGETDTRVLEFDHVRSVKLDDVSRLLACAARWERVAAEIQKCEVRCANCHRRRTAKQLGWHADHDEVEPIAPGGTRTLNRQIRSLELYPIELQAHEMGE